jgi:hypothetical protein
MKGNEVLNSWFSQIDKGQEMPGIQQSGWVKIPFINGFCYLLHGMTYTEALSNC